MGRLDESSTERCDRAHFLSRSTAIHTMNFHGISGSPRLKRPPISQGLTRPESQLMVADSPKNALERALIFVLPWSTGVMIPS
jgi:hypothetical protein